MKMARIETWVNQDLKQPVKMIYPKGNFFEDDDSGNLVGVRVFNEGLPFSLSGSCIGYCILANGVSIPINGSLSENTASVVIPPSAYTVPGPIVVILKVVNGLTTTTLAAICTTVIGIGNNVSDPSAAVIAEWTAQINATLSALENGAVLYSESQSLTSSQKLQARNNIGANTSAVQIFNDKYKIIVP